MTARGLEHPPPAGQTCDACNGPLPTEIPPGALHAPFYGMEEHGPGDLFVVKYACSLACLLKLQELSLDIELDGPS